MVSIIKRSSLISCCVLIVLTSFIFPASAADTTYEFNCPNPMDAGFDGFCVVPIHASSSYVPSVLVAWSITPIINVYSQTSTTITDKSSVVTVGTFVNGAFDINFSTNNSSNEFMVTWFYMFNGDTNISGSSTAYFDYNLTHSIHYELSDLISTSSYPSAKFVRTSTFGGISQINSTASDVGFTYNCLFSGDVAVYKTLLNIYQSIVDIESNTDSLETKLDTIASRVNTVVSHLYSLLSKVDITNDKLIKILSDTNAVVTHFSSLLDKVDYTNEQLEDIVLKFYELLEVSYSISGTLDDFVYYYWEEFSSITFPEQIYAITSRLDLILRALNRSGNSEQTTADTSNIDNYVDIEQSLVHNDEAQSAINDMDVSITGKAYSFIWNLITRILNSHPEVFGLVIAILTLGFIALLLNR